MNKISFLTVFWSLLQIIKTRRAKW